MATTSGALEGKLVFYRDGQTFTGGVVVEDGRKGLRIKGPEREVKVSGNAVLAVVDDRGLAKRASESLTAVREAVANMDLRTTWELVVEESNDPLELDDLLALCGEGESALDRAALLVALDIGESYFKRKGDRFAPLSAKAVAERDEQQARAAQKEAAMAQQVSELKGLGQGEGVESLSADGRAALLAIQDCAVAQDATPAATRLLEALLPESGSPAPVAALDWLIETGVFDEHEDLGLRRLGANQTFPDAVEENAQELVAALPDRLARRDLLQHVELVAIDDAETVEVDDAIGFEPTPDGGGRIHVVICDVAAAIPRDCAVDQEALARATTIYHPAARYLMLPQVLAEDALTLAIDEERLVLDHIFSIDAKNQVYDFSVKAVRATLNRRLTYEEADEEIASKPDGNLARLWSIAEGLFNERVNQGAVHFFPVEVKLRVDNGEVTTSAVDNFSTARRLVSEYMVACGGAVGRMLAEQMVPAIYRRQVAPSDPIEWDEESASDPVFILENVRKLKRAEISLQPDRHHALGLMAYCQVTSPLRRYGDLLMQRQLHSFLVRRVTEYGDGELLRQMSIADQTALQVRKVVASAERYWALVAMSRRLGDSVEAVVVNDHPRRELVLILDYALQTKFFPKRPVHAGETLLLKIARAVPRTETLVLEEA